MKFLDYFNLRMQLASLPVTIPDKIIEPIITDEQFAVYGYDYDILFIIEKVFTATSLATEKHDLNYIKEWINNFINQLQRLSQHNYSDNDLLIFKQLIFYKILFATTNANLMVYFTEHNQEFLDDMLNILLIPVSSDSSVWLAQNEIRELFFKLFRNEVEVVQDNMLEVAKQLDIALANEENKKQLETILGNFKYL